MIVIRDAAMMMIINQKINDIKGKPGRFTDQDVDWIFNDFKRCDFSQGVDDCNMEIGFFIDTLLEEQKFTEYSVEKASEIANSVCRFCMGDFTFVNRLGRIELSRKRYIPALIALCKAMQLNFTRHDKGVDNVIYMNIQLAIKHSQLFKISETNKIPPEHLNLVLHTLQEINQRFYNQEPEGHSKICLSIVNLLFQQGKYVEAKRFIDTEMLVNIINSVAQLAKIQKQSGFEIYQEACTHNVTLIESKM